ncbi:MAG: uncharacterized protein QOJ26_652 [Thermoplasmata archaeon]|nr:uncharacterized protein [Thermoplasmata archaeon]
MALLTLVPDALAARGFRFTFAGPNKGEECAGCPFQKLCFGLDPGRTYKVTSVRDVAHPCALHDTGKARVVVVEEVPFQATIERHHLRGTAAPWTAPNCRRPSCKNWALCHPVGHTAGGRHAITAQKGAVECPVGFDLERVDLKPMD